MITPPLVLLFNYFEGGDSMNYSDYRLTFDIHDIRSNIIVKVKRGDNTRRLCISLTEKGKVYQIADRCTAVFKGKKPDGKSLLNDCSIEDNTIYYVMGNNTTNAVGIVDSEVSLIGGDGKTITSPTFSIQVEDTPVHDDDVIDSTDEAGAFVSLVGRVTNVEERVSDLEENGVNDEAISDLNELINDVERDLSKVTEDLSTVTTDLSNMGEDVDSLMQYEQDIENIRNIDTRVGIIENEVVPDMEGRITKLEDTAPIVDDALSSTSTNPVQNKVVTESIRDIGGTVSAMNSRVSALEQNGGGGGGSVAVDDVLSETSENPVQNKVVTEELNAIRDYADNINDTANEAKDVAAQAEQVAREMSQDVAWLMEHEQAISDLQGYENRITNVEQDVNNQKQSFDQLAEREAELEERVGGLQGSVQNIEQRTIPELAERVTYLEDVDVVTSVNGMDGAVQLTATDVGALPSTTKIPSKVSDLTNDNGYLTDYTETDPTVPSWAKAASKPTYTASEVGARPNTWMPSHTDVGADKAGTANTTVATHNTKTDAHNDIRLLITALTTRLDALANSDDDTLDQMAEVVAYIKANRDLIDQITTGKVSVADIVNNLTTNVTNKPLSAAQGVALKTLIDAITVPTKLSELDADNSSVHVSYSEKSAWNAKSDFSGAYDDLTGKPTIPTVPTKVSAFTNDKGYLTEETDPTVPAWAKASTKPSYSKSEVGLGNVDNVKQYSASNPPPYPVTSVNGKTGAVTVSVPTKTSQLTNDSNFLTAHQDISGKADKSSAETWTFTLEDGSTVPKKVVLA